MIIAPDNIADISLRPMALFAERLGRPRIILGHMDRPVEVITDSMIKLFDPIDFGSEIGGSAWTNMAGNTFDLGMGGMLSCDKLRLHWKVTCLAAKLDRFRNMICLIASYRGDQQHHGASASKNAQDLSVTWTG